MLTSDLVLDTKVETGSNELSFGRGKKGNFYPNAFRVNKRFKPRRYSTWILPVRNTQFSGSRTCLAEYTRHGSAYVGEFKILRAKLLDEAMTIKLRQVRLVIIH